MNADIELLELIAELNMSDDKSRKAIGAEIKRLTNEMRTELEALRAVVEAAEKMFIAFRDHKDALFHAGEFNEALKKLKGG